MKIAYFDAPTGLAGNMILGALLDSGAGLAYLKKELRKLKFTSDKSQTNYKLQFSKTKAKGLAFPHFEVTTKKESEHRNLSAILNIIKKSKLSPQVKLLSSRIFRRLAEAEAKVHGTSINKVHFHEVGALDAIIDIVGTVICLDKLGIEKVYCSPLPFGKGSIKHAHGILPNPAPATTELLKGVPTYGTNLKGELVTPTGAAIISTICHDFTLIPRLKLETAGYSAGTRSLGIPNILRVFIGESELATERDVILQIETNIDDMAPKQYSKAIAKLMKAGALDAYITPIIMKKERRGANLVVLGKPEDREQLLEALFEETTVLGTRIFLVAREKLKRKYKTVRTKYGKAKIKIGLLGTQPKTIAPEYEDYKKLAAKHHVPLSLVHQAIIRSASRRRTRKSGTSFQ